MIDYTAQIQGCWSGDGALLAQGQGRHVLVLHRLDTPCRRFDDKMARYQVEYRELSTTCECPDDEAFVCVQGNEYTYWQARELPGIVQNGNIVPGANLFDAIKII